MYFVISTIPKPTMWKAVLKKLKVRPNPSPTAWPSARCCRSATNSNLKSLIPGANQPAAWPGCDITYQVRVPGVADAADRDGPHSHPRPGPNVHRGPPGGSQSPQSVPQPLHPDGPLWPTVPPPPRPPPPPGPPTHPAQSPTTMATSTAHKGQRLGSTGFEFLH